MGNIDANDDNDAKEEEVNVLSDRQTLRNSRKTCFKL